MPQNISASSLPYLGKLSYCGSPTDGTVIVYAAAQNRWARVPVQEIVAQPNMSDPFIVKLLKANPMAQWMLAFCLLGLTLMIFGIYGYAK